MRLLRVRAGLGMALCAGGCGFDSSGTDTGAAEIGEATGADEAPESGAGPGPADDDDAATTTSVSTAGSDTATTGTLSLTDASASTDPSAGTTDASGWGPFEDPLPIAQLNSAAEEDDPTMRGDLLEIVFATTRSGTSEDIMFATRMATNLDFDPPQLLPANINTVDVNETTPEMTLDGLALTFASNRPGGLGGSDLFVTWRTDTASPWMDPVRITELESADNEAAFVVTQDGLVGYFCRYAAGFEEQLMNTVRASTAQPWNAPVELRIDTPMSDCSPWVSPTGGELWFNSWRAGGQGQADLWFSVVDEAIGEPVVVDELNSALRDEDPWLSATGDLIVFASDRDGPTDLYWAVRAPL